MKTNSFFRWRTKNQYSFLFQQSRGLGGQIVREILPSFADEINLTNRNKKTVIFALEYFLYNCWICRNFQKVSSDREIVCSYSRREVDYKKIHRYFPLKSFRALMAIVDIAEKAGYILSYSGFYDKTNPNLSRRSAFRPTAKMDTLFSNKKVEVHHIENIDPIRLKDADKQLINYEDTSFTNDSRKNIQKINNLFKNHKVELVISDEELEMLKLELLEDKKNKESLYPLKKFKRLTSNYSLHLPPLSPSSPTLEDLEISYYFQLLRETKVAASKYDFNSIISYHRTFNETFDRGGRFYSDFQDLPSKLRKRITINGNPVVSLDYSALHLNMAYALNGLASPEQDLYLGTSLPRKLAKLASLILINASTIDSAARSMVNEGICTYHEAKRFIDDFKKLHAPIANWICSGKGTYLQNLDSRIAEKVMLSYAGRGLVCLGIHDGFIVEKRFENDLLETMKLTYKYLMKQEINVKRE